MTEVSSPLRRAWATANEASIYVSANSTSEVSSCNRARKRNSKACVGLASHRGNTSYLTKQPCATSSRRPACGWNS